MDRRFAASYVSTLRRGHALQITVAGNAGGFSFSQIVATNTSPVRGLDVVRDALVCTVKLISYRSPHVTTLP